MRFQLWEWGFSYLALKGSYYCFDCLHRKLFEKKHFIYFLCEVEMKT